jgi:hypothetical protein
MPPVTPLSRPGRRAESAVYVRRVLGQGRGSPTVKRGPIAGERRNTRSEALCAPSAIRTRALLLRSNPAVDAVAISDDAGQVSGATHCCSPSYLVIAIEDTGRTIAAKDTTWTVPQAVASSRLTVLGPSATAGDSWRCDPAARHVHLPDGHQQRPRRRGRAYDNRLVLPRRLPAVPVPSGRTSCAAGTLVHGTCRYGRDGVIVTEDPRKTRRNGPDPVHRAIEIREKRRGVLASCLAWTPSAPAGAGQEGHAGRREQPGRSQADRGV